MFDTEKLARLLTLAHLLDKKAGTQEAHSKELLANNEKTEAAKESTRAHRNRGFAALCRDAHAALSKPLKCRVARKTAAAEDSPAFAAFWAAYPTRRRTGKGDARRAWIAMNCESIAEKIMAGLERSKGSVDWTKDAGDFVPMPATWLRREGWEDVCQPTQKTLALARHDADPAGWREFLEKLPMPYKPYRSAPEWVKSDFANGRK